MVNKPTYNWGGPILYLVGGFNPSDKYYILVSWDDYSQYMEN